MTRLNLVTTLFGARGTGKTYFIKNELMPLYSSGKILIIDTLDHPLYRDIPTIKLSQISRWKRGTYRFYGDPEEIEQLFDLLNRFGNNMLMICEDAQKYTGTQLSRPLKKLIIDSKQKNIDMIFLFHSWGWVPLDLFRITDRLEIFKTNDSPEDRKSMLKPVWPMVWKAYQEVTKSKTRWEHRTVAMQ
jgi:hypothetical protein